MCTLPDTSGYDSFGETSGEDRAAELSAERKRQSKELVSRANRASLKSIFKHYNLTLDEHSRRCCCPFTSKHKNGRDGTPSFHFYPDTNSFHCFGCKTGRGPVDFVAAMENIGRVEAAQKILEDHLSSSFSDDLGQIEEINYSERHLLIMSFSDIAREFYKSNQGNREAIDFIDKICYAFDTICSKHNMSNESIKSLVEKLKAKVEKYNKCHLY